MKKSYEDQFGKLDNHEIPSAEYLSSKLDECEQEEPMASPLDEVASQEDSENQSLSATLDLQGRIRITKQKAKGKLPQTSEELRMRLRVEGNTWLFIATKMHNKPWLQKLSPQTWSKYADYLLGEKVYNLTIPGHDDKSSTPVRPPWPVILHYEQQIRKKAFREVRESGTRINDALVAARRDSELKEIHFASPLALLGSSRSRQILLTDRSGRRMKIRKSGTPKDRIAMKGDGKERGKVHNGKLLTVSEDGRQRKGSKMVSALEFTFAE